MTSTADPAVALAGTGLSTIHPVFANLSAPSLVAQSLRRDEGRLSADGALLVNTGVHTGRSPKDKFVVDEPGSRDKVWWGSVNQRLAPEKFATLKGRVQAYLQGQQLYTQDLYAGADPAHRVKVRVVTKNPLWLAVWWTVPRNFCKAGEPTTPFLWYLHCTTPRRPSRRTSRSAPSSPLAPTRSTS